MPVQLSNKALAERIEQIFADALLRQQTINEIELKGLKQYVKDNFSMSAQQTQKFNLIQDRSWDKMQGAVLEPLKDNFDLAVHLSRPPDWGNPILFIGIHCEDIFDPDDPEHPIGRKCTLDIGFC